MTALALVAVWALAEATVFFIVADVPIMALGIKAGWRKALVGAGAASVFAAIGGAFVWLWASTQPKEAIAVMLAVPAIDEDLMRSVFDQWQNHGVIGMTIGSFSGVPYKLYALAAGSTGGQSIVALALFSLASIVARLPRFALVAVIAGWLGPKLVGRFGSRPVWIVFALAWTGFYAWYWSVMEF